MIIGQFSQICHSAMEVMSIRPQIARAEFNDYRWNHKRVGKNILCVEEGWMELLTFVWLNVLCMMRREIIDIIEKVVLMIGTR